MKCDIVISGVGGQGILSIATVLGRAALSAGLRIKQAEVHGMAQRGGAVQSHFRISDKPVFSDVIPQQEADLVVSMEPMESLRYIGWLSPEGWLISNRDAYENIPDYPDLEAVHKDVAEWPRHLLVDGTALAREAGSVRALNMAMLGAASPFMSLLKPEQLKKAISEQFASKGEEIVQTNLDAFQSARDVALARQKELN